MHPRWPKLVAHSFYTFIFYVVEECHLMNTGNLFSITCKLFNFFCRSNGFESPGSRSRSQSPTKRSSRFQKPTKQFKPRNYDVISDYNPQFFSTSGRIEKEVPLLHGQRVTVLGKSWQSIIHLYHSSLRRFDYKIMSTTLFLPLYQCGRN